MPVLLPLALRRQDLHKVWSVNLRLRSVWLVSHSSLFKDLAENWRMVWRDGFKFSERKLDIGREEETELEDVNNKTQKAVDQAYLCDKNVWNTGFMSGWFVLLCFILTSRSCPGVRRCVFPSWGRDSDHGDSSRARCMRSPKPFFHYLWIVTRTFTVSIVFRGQRSGSAKAAQKKIRHCLLLLTGAMC